jgi:glycerol-3-phosphate cytidylyltransferase
VFGKPPGIIHFEIESEARVKMKKVITYGTYDLLHRGHINLLRRAKEMGDYLVVALSTDAFNAVKGKQVYYRYEERRLVLEAVRYVDEVIPEKIWEQKVQDVVQHKIDIFVMGEDWSGKFDFLKPHCEVIYLPRTEGISTTQIKLDLSGNHDFSNAKP